jgi:hypothetical protein
VDHFQVLHRCVPGIEKDSLGLYAFVGDSVDEHLSEMIVLCFSIAIGVINTEIDRKVAAAIAVRMDQIHNVNPANQSVFRSAVLELHKFDIL